jgi:tRNA threonylcarbamoyl adenosine modification protein (Sua5/YciO/YrdC/YwlC family)
VGLAEALEASAEALKAGALLVFPTDTVYGIACRPDASTATDRLFEAKRRPPGLNLPVLAPSTEAALDLSVPDDAARRLARAFWPGPLTMVLARGERSSDWALGEATRTIGVRVPDHVFSLALLARTGPLAATSANISGEKPLADLASLREVFGLAVAVYIVERGAADRSAGRSSTVVDLTGQKLRVVREGPINAAAISSVAGISSGARTNPHSVH